MLAASLEPGRHDEGMTTTPPLGSDAARFPAVRLAVGYAAIAGTVPYLVLKTMWLTGSSVGVVDRAFLRDPSVLVLNGVTAGMDVVVILVALALTHRWGERLPAWLVLTPMWVGTGFLAPIAVALPVVALGEALTSAAPPSVAVASPALPLEPWVQPMVYAGFAWQGVTLLAAFVLYARVRWAEVFRPSIAPLGAAHAAHAAVANGAALLALTAAGVHLLWAFGGTAGLSDEAAAARDLTPP